MILCKWAENIVQISFRHRSTEPFCQILDSNLPFQPETRISIEYSGGIISRLLKFEPDTLGHKWEGRYIPRNQYTGLLLIQELKPIWRMCQSRLQYKSYPLFRAGGLRPLEHTSGAPRPTLIRWILRLAPRQAHTVAPCLWPVRGPASRRGASLRVSDPRAHLRRAVAPCFGNGQPEHASSAPDQWQWGDVLTLSHCAFIPPPHPRLWIGDYDAMLRGTRYQRQM